jgi:hypothetical protein
LSYGVNEPINELILRAKSVADLIKITSIKESEQ